MHVNRQKFQPHQPVDGGLVVQVAVQLEVEDINAHLTRLDGVDMMEQLRRQVTYSRSGGEHHCLASRSSPKKDPRCLCALHHGL